MSKGSSFSLLTARLSQQSTLQVAFKQLICTSCVLERQRKKTPQNAELNFTKGTLYSNPVDRLRDLMEVPLFKDGEEIFMPSLDKIEAGEELFKPKRGHEITYLQGALFAEQLPNETIPEVAFAGRSNVGKSSLIKALFCHSPEVIVRTSKTPGHTKILNFFKVGKSFHVVDMPGYGENMPQYFVESAESYLQQRKSLRTSFLLIDGAEGVTDVDRVGINMMEQYAVPYTVVVTKVDKVSAHVLLRHLLDILALREQRLVHCLPQPFLVSSVTGEGVALLQTFIAYVTGRLGVPGL